MPEDPCRMLGGHRMPKKQSRPVDMHIQVSEAQTLKRLRKRSGIRLSRKYHALKLKEFANQGKKDRVYGVNFGGIKFYT